MKYDYTKAFKLINKIPNLNNTFVALPTTRSAVRLLIKQKLTLINYYIR